MGLGAVLGGGLLLCFFRGMKVGFGVEGYGEDRWGFCGCVWRLVGGFGRAGVTVIAIWISASTSASKACFINALRHGC